MNVIIRTLIMLCLAVVPAVAGVKAVEGCGGISAFRQFVHNELAGNVRANFGLTTADQGREFVAFGAEGNSGPASGQPLPGALALGSAVLTAALAGRIKMHMK